jgi:hypothetical protein
VAQDPKVPGRLLGDMSSPHGMLAGEWAEYGDFGTMAYVKHLSAGIRASPLAKMECHALDDFVRIVAAGRFEHVSPGGYDIAFDDGGYCSRERVVCPVCGVGAPVKEAHSHCGACGGVVACGGVDGPPGAAAYRQ